MMLNKNIKNLRKEKGLTQAQLANKLSVKRSLIGAYEEGRAEPKLSLLLNMAQYFKVSIDTLLSTDLTKEADFKKIKGEQLRVLPITVDRNTDQEHIPLVPIKASAGYASGYGDIDYIEDLSQFSLPFSELGSGKSHRIFQTNGDSMLPIKSGSYIICEYVQDWHTIKDNLCYVIVTLEDGVIYKRIENHLSEKKNLKLISDNSDYEPYYLNINQVVEVWKAVGFTSFNIPENQPTLPGLKTLIQEVAELRKDISQLKK